MLLDENLEAEGHDFFSVDAFDVSPDQQLLAWSADVEGGEKYTLHIRDLNTGADTDDVVHDIAWCGTAWSHDNASLFYVTANEAMRPYRVWRHDLGTDEADDTLVFEETDERFYVYVKLSRSGKWVIIDTRSKTSSEVLLIPADDPKQEPIIARPRADDVEYAVDHWGDQFVILTNLDAEDFRVMTAPIDAPSVWKELVGHQHGRRIVADRTIRTAPGAARVERCPAAPARAVGRGRRTGLRPRSRTARGRDRRQPRVDTATRFVIATSR